MKKENSPPPENDPSPGPRKRLTRKLVKEICERVDRGEASETIAAELNLNSPDMVERATAKRSAGASEEAPDLRSSSGTSGGTPPPPTADALVALAATTVTTVTRTAGMAARLDGKETTELCRLQPDERKALETLAPYTADAFPAVAAKAAILCAMAFGILIAVFIGIRLSAIKAISYARSKSLRRDHRDGKNARSAGGPTEDQTSARGPGPGGERASGEYPAQAAWEQDPSKVGTLDARDS